MMRVNFKTMRQLEQYKAAQMTEQEAAALLRVDVQELRLKAERAGYGPWYARLFAERRDGCVAKRYSDQMQCARCGLAWDAGDEDPPSCINV